MDKIKIILIIVSIALLIAAGFIINDRFVNPYINERAIAINNSYDAGYNQGLERWNSQVIYQVNNDGVIPYWFNGTYYELNIAQICGGLQ